MTNEIFQIEMEVRDYECDQQGIVNNAVYSNYFEHARHKYLISRGLDFVKLNEINIFLVTVRSEIDYIISLKSKNEFIVRVKFIPDTKLRGIFEHEILLSSNMKVAARSKTFVVAINEHNKPLLLSSVGLLTA